MPSFEVSSPAGKKYKIDLPEGTEMSPELENDILSDIQGYESGFEQSSLGVFGNKVAQGLGSVVAEPIRGVGEVFESPYIAEAGKNLSESVESNFQVSPDRQDTFAAKAGSAIGQGIGQLGLALGTGGLGLGARAVQGAVLAPAFFAGAAGAADESRRLGIEDTWSDKFNQIAGGGVEVLSESIFGLGSKAFARELVSDIPNVLLRGVRSTAAGRFAKGVGQEALEEPLAGAGQDFAARLASEFGGVVDPNRPGFTVNGAELRDPLDLSARAEEAFYGAIGAGPFGVREALNTDADAQEVLGYRTRVNEARKNGTVAEDSEATVNEYDAKAEKFLEAEGVARMKSLIQLAADGSSQGALELKQIINDPAAPPAARARAESRLSRQRDEATKALEAIEAFSSAEDPDKALADLRAAIPEYETLNPFSKTNQAKAMEKAEEARASAPLVAAAQENAAAGNTATAAALIDVQTSRDKASQLRRQARTARKAPESTSPQAAAPVATPTQPSRRAQIQGRLAEIEQAYGPRADVIVGADGYPTQVRPRRINSTEEDALLKELDALNATESQATQAPANAAPTEAPSREEQLAAAAPKYFDESVNELIPRRVQNISQALAEGDVEMAMSHLQNLQQLAKFRPLSSPEAIDAMSARLSPEEQARITNGMEAARKLVQQVTEIVKAKAKEMNTPIAESAVRQLSVGDLPLFSNPASATTAPAPVSTSTPVTVSSPAASGVEETADPKLPAQLKAAVPFKVPSHGETVLVNFESDLDEALFQSLYDGREGATDHLYREWVSQVTGLSEEDVLVKARELTQKVEALLASSSHMDVTVPKQDVGPAPASSAEVTAPVEEAAPAPQEVSELEAVDAQLALNKIKREKALARARKAGARVNLGFDPFEQASIQARLLSSHVELGYLLVKKGYLKFKIWSREYLKTADPEATGLMRRIYRILRDTPKVAADMLHVPESEVANFSAGMDAQGSVSRTALDTLPQVPEPLGVFGSDENLMDWEGNTTFFEGRASFPGAAKAHRIFVNLANADDLVNPSHKLSYIYEGKLYDTGDVVTKTEAGWQFNGLAPLPQRQEKFRQYTTTLIDLPFVSAGQSAPAGIARRQITAFNELVQFDDEGRLSFANESDIARWAVSTRYVDGDARYPLTVNRESENAISVVLGKTDKAVAQFIPVGGRFVLNGDQDFTKAIEDLQLKFEVLGFEVQGSGGTVTKANIPSKVVAAWGTPSRTYSVMEGFGPAPVSPKGQRILPPTNEPPFKGYKELLEWITEKRLRQGHRLDINLVRSYVKRRGPRSLQNKITGAVKTAEEEYIKVYKPEAQDPSVVFELRDNNNVGVQYARFVQGELGLRPLFTNNVFETAVQINMGYRPVVPVGFAGPVHPSLETEQQEDGSLVVLSASDASGKVSSEGDHLRVRQSDKRVIAKSEARIMSMDELIESIGADDAFVDGLPAAENENTILWDAVSKKFPKMPSPSAIVGDRLLVETLAATLLKKQMRLEVLRPLVEGTGYSRDGVIIDESKRDAAIKAVRDFITARKTAVEAERTRLTAEGDSTRGLEDIFVLPDRLGDLVDAAASAKVWRHENSDIINFKAYWNSATRKMVQKFRTRVNSGFAAPLLTVEYNEEGAEQTGIEDEEQNDARLVEAGLAGEGTTVTFDDINDVEEGDESFVAPQTPVSSAPQQLDLFSGKPVAVENADDVDDAPILDTAEEPDLEEAPATVLSAPLTTEENVERETRNADRLQISAAVATERTRRERSDMRRILRDLPIELQNAVFNSSSTDRFDKISRLYKTMRAGLIKAGVLRSEARPSFKEALHLVFQNKAKIRGFEKMFPPATKDIFAGFYRAFTGAPGLSSSAEAASVAAQLGLESGNPQSAIDALEVIAESRQVPEGLRLLAARLADMPNVRSLRGFSILPMKGFRGVYLTEEHAIALAPDGSLISASETLIHELSHAALEGAFQELQNGTASKEVVQADNDLTKLREELKRASVAFGFTGQYAAALESNEEFTATFMSDPAFNAWVSARPKGFLQKILSALRRLLGLPVAVDKVWASINTMAERPAIFAQTQEAVSEQFIAHLINDGTPVLPLFAGTTANIPDSLRASFMEAQDRMAEYELSLAEFRSLLEDFNSVETPLILERLRHAGKETYPNVDARVAKALANLIRPTPPDYRTPQDIYKATGWFKAPTDKQWRWEISDNEAVIDSERLGRLEHGFLSNLLSHPKLFAAYPILDRVLVERTTLSPNVRGTASVRGDAALVQLSNTLTPEQALSTLLHEVQHVIQAREGFFPGTNLKQAATFVNDVRGASQAYRRFPGEIEARATQARREFNDEQRRRNFTPEVIYPVTFIVEKLREAANKGFVQSAQEVAEDSSIEFSSEREAPAWYDHGKKTIFLNPEIVAEETALMNEKAAKNYAVKLIEHENIHKADLQGSNLEDVLAYRDAMTEADREWIANLYWVDPAQRERALGLTPGMTPEEISDARTQLALEHRRAMIELATTGETTEQFALLASTNPGLARRVLDSVVKFFRKLVARLEIRFYEGSALDLQTLLENINNMVEADGIDPSQINLAFANSVAIPLRSRNQGSYKAGGWGTTGYLSAETAESTKERDAKLRSIQTQIQMHRDDLASAVKEEYTKKGQPDPETLINTALGSIENPISPRQLAIAEAFRTRGIRQAVGKFLGEMNMASAMTDPAQAALVRENARKVYATELKAAKGMHRRYLANIEDRWVRSVRAKQAAAFTALSPKTSAAVRKIRDDLDEQQDNLIASGILGPRTMARVVKTRGIYLSRSYQIFNEKLVTATGVKRNLWSEFLRRQKDPAAIRIIGAARAAIFEEAAIERAKKIRRDNTRARTPVGPFQSVAQQKAAIKTARAANPQITAADALAKARAELNINPAEVDRKVAEYIAMGEDMENDTDVLKHRENIHPAIQALWGVYEKNTYNAFNTMSKINALLANQKMFQDIYTHGKAQGYIFDDPNHTIDGALVVPLGGTGTQQNRNRFGALAGTYGPPYLAAGLQETFANSASVSTLWNVMRAFTGFAMATKTKYSLQGTARNFIGNVMFAAVNLNLHKLVNPKAYQVVARQLNGLSENKTRFDEYIKKLIELRVVSESAYEFRELSREFSNQYLTRFDAFISGKKGLEQAAGAVRKVDKIAGRLHQSADDFWKVVAFEGELAAVKRWEPTLSQEEAEAKAAWKVRQTMPTYTEAFYFIKRLRQQPFIAPFVTFTAEMYRTTFGTLRVGLSEIREGHKNGNRMQVAHGLTRNMMLVSSLGLTSYLMTAIGKELFGAGEDDEEEASGVFGENALSRFVPEYMKGNTLLRFKGKSWNEQIYMDASYMIPQDILGKVLRMTIDAAVKPEAGNAAERAVDAGAAFIAQVLEPVTKEQLFFGSVMQAYYNYNKAYDRKIYKDTDTAWEATTAMVRHIYTSALEPGTVRTGRLIWEAADGTVRDGMKLEVPNEAMGVLGIKKRTIVLDTRFTKNADMNKMKLGEAAQYVTTPLQSNSTVADEDISDGYRRANEVRMDILREARRDYLAAQQLGMPQGKAIALLKESQLSEAEVGMVVGNLYTPYQVSEQVFEKALEKSKAIGQDRVRLYIQAAKEYPKKQPLIPEP